MQGSGKHSSTDTIMEAPVTNILLIEDAGKEEYVSASVDNSSADAFLIGTAVEDAEDCCRQTFHPSMVSTKLQDKFGLYHHLGYT
jgi:hypothetical protein